MRRISLSRGRARRPRGAARLGEKDELNSEVDRGGLGHYYESPSKSRASSSMDVPAASMHVAAIMSEQQAIISRLREFLRSGRGGSAELLCSADFQEVVAR